MTDRLTLTRAFEEAGMQSGVAEHIATEIYDAIHANVATKQDIEALRVAMKQDIETLRVATKQDTAAVSARIDLIEHRLLTRLGGLVVVVATILFAALHHWPPHAS